MNDSNSVTIIKNAGKI